MILIRLFLEFLKIGTFSVGGGMATLPFLYDMADKTGWCSYSQIADMLAVSESTPGPIGINMATYVGYSVAGIAGAAAATLGIIIPGVLLVLLVSSILHRFSGNRYVEGAFYGIRPASVGLISAAGILVAKITFFRTQSGDASLISELIAMFKPASDAALSSGILHFVSSTAAAFAEAIDVKTVLIAALLLYLTRSLKATKNLHPVIFIAFSAAVGIIFSFE